MSTVSIGEALASRAVASFEQPESMLLACHQRVLRMCNLLERLCEHVRQHGADTQARQAATDILRYFDLAAPLHHQDEELHLIPRLQAAGHTAWADTILSQHEIMEAMWRTLGAVLRALEQGDPAPLLSSTLPPRFVALYHEHIDLEENHAYPAVLSVLSDQEQEKIGKEMEARRKKS